MQGTSSWADGLEFVGDDERLVAHTGLLPLRLLADRTGLTGKLSAALARCGFDPVYDRGQVLLDLALVLSTVGRRSATFRVPTVRRVPPPATGPPGRGGVLPRPARTHRHRRRHEGPALGVLACAGRAPTPRWTRSPGFRDGLAHGIEQNGEVVPDTFVADLMGAAGCWISRLLHFVASWRGDRSRGGWDVIVT